MGAHSLDEKPGPLACVTGATGLIGGRLVPRLLRQGYRVRVLSRRQSLAMDRVEVCCGGLEDEAAVREFLKGARLLFHCAAELADQSRMWDVNVAGTERLLRLAAAAGIEYLCHLSSAGVVGRTNQTWVTEAAPCQPQNLYERTKLEAERLAARLGSGCRTVILRPTNVVDHHKPGALGLPERAALADRLKVFVTGGECAHIVHAEDVAAAAVFFISAPLNRSEVFFVSCDHEPLNTVAGLWALYRACREGRPLERVKPVAHLPLIVPYWLRRLRRARGNRGDVRYSPKRLLATGFTFPLGLVGAIKQVIRDQGTVAP